MAATVARLSGREWQDWANKLLSHHHGHAEYQRVPDHAKGDAGIEGFTRSSACAYQAYGCEEPLSTDQRFVKQRDKMTQDIAKFIANQTALTKLLGHIRITRWILFVPYYDSKDIVAHASRKTAEVSSHKLPYVDGTFQVAICQEDDLAVARDALLRITDGTLNIITANSTDKDVNDWTSKNPDPSAVLTSKLEKLPTLKSAADRRRYHDTVLRWYLEGQDLLDALKAYPGIYTQVLGVKAHREKYLAAAQLSGTPSKRILSTALEELKTSLGKEVRELHKFPAEVLAHEGIADWLLRCPLDFP